MSEQPDLFGLRRYPFAPGSKPGAGRDTSQAAAVAITPRANALRERAYSVIAELQPISADGVAARMRLSVLSVRPRVSELAAAGRIMRADGRAKNESGQSAAMWRVAPQSSRATT